MTCDNQIGAKNIMLTFRDCETDEVFGPISHELADDSQPTYRLCGYNNEMKPGGYVTRTKDNEQIIVTVVRDLRIPLELYQGCASTDVQIEHFNGLVYSAVSGTATGNDASDAHAVTLTMSFRQIDELLPVGVLDNEAA